MPSDRNYSRLLLALLILLCAGVLHGLSPAQQNAATDEDSNPAAAQGRRSFSANCAGCHGLDGRGSDKAPNIAETEKARGFSDAQLSDIISRGISGTGMPAFHNLNEQQVHALVGHLRTLQGKLDAKSVPGDAARGKGIFFGKAGCSACHTVSGEGGFLGPDLSAYGPAKSAKAIQDEIVRQDRFATTGYRQGTVISRDGKRLEGIIRNEDNFSLQLQTKDGSFHFFQKAELQKVEHSDQSLMPTNYRERLSVSELNDLVSFLMSTGRDAGTAATSRKTEEPTE